MKSLLHQSREKKGLCGPKDPPIQPDSRGLRGNIEQTPSSPPVSDRLRACCGITKKQAYILPGNSVHPRAMPPSALVVLIRPMDIPKDQGILQRLATAVLARDRAARLAARCPQ